VGAVLVAYANAFGGDFQFDDYNVIVGNPAVHSLSAWFADLRGIRPLLKLTYAVNWISGLGLFGFHLFNVAFHAANGVMVYLLLRRFGGASARGGEPRPYEVPALFAALLFALHPVQTEAVTYVSGRSMSLMAFFYLGSLLAYVRGRESASKAWLYVVSPVLFVLALLTKETAVTLPVAILLWEAAGRDDRGNRVRSIFRAQAVHWGILFAALVSLVLHPGYARFLSSNLGIRNLGDNLLIQIDGISYLLYQLVRPSRLNIDPTFAEVAGWTWGLAGEALVLGSLLAAGIASLRRRPWLGFGVLWFFLHLLPTNSIIPRLDAANERHLYVAGIGLFFAAAVQLREWSLRLAADRRIVRAGAAVLLVVLGLITVSRNHDYRSEIALWESSVRADPRNARAFNNLGHAYALAGESEKAGSAYREALRLNPGYDLARRNLAILE
jgi:tetratricopeptide (TPR) repeat protein